MIEKYCENIHGYTVMSNDEKHCYYAHKETDKNCKNCKLKEGAS